MARSYTYTETQLEELAAKFDSTGTNEGKEKIKQLLRYVERFNLNLGGKIAYLSRLNNEDARKKFKDENVAKSIEQQKENLLESFREKTRKLLEYSNSLSQPTMQHLESVIRHSNMPIESSEDYTVACMLKAFAIEYISKLINIFASGKIEDVSITEINKPEHQRRDKNQIMNEFMKQVKDEVLAEIQHTDPTVTRFLGHEIYDLLQHTPSHLRNLIKYKAISYSANKNIAEKGSLAEPVMSEIDFFIMIKDFTFDSTVETQDETLKNNNLAFVDYRYLKENAEREDYELLNATMVAAYTVLKGLIDSSAYTIIHEGEIPNEYKIIKDCYSKELSDLITSQPSKKTVLDNFLKGMCPDKTNPQDVEKLNSLCLNRDDIYQLTMHLTPKEVNLLISNKNTNNIIEMTHYIIMLKKYIAQRHINVNEDRYKRINKLFQSIKATGITSLTEQFKEWYQSIDQYSLTKEELRELEGVFPQYFYKSLSYQDKHIYNECKKRNIIFEYYYQNSIDTFNKIAELPENEFQGKSIPPELIFQKAENIGEYYTCLKKHNLSISEVPAYYFKFTPQEIFLAHSWKYTPQFDNDELETSGLTEEDIIQSPYVSLEELKYVRKTQRAYEIMDIENLNASMSQDEMNRLINSSHQTAAYYQEEYERKKIQRNANIIHLRSMPTLSEKNTLELLQEGFTIEEITFAKLTKELEKSTKLTTRELLEMSYEELLNINRGEHRRPSSLTPTNDNSRGQTSYTKMKKIMNELPYVSPEMKAISPTDIMLSYIRCRDVYPGIEPGNYLLYKTPEEVASIISSVSTDFLPEMLYLDQGVFEELEPTIIKSQIEQMRRKVHGDNIDISSVQINYEKAKEVNEILKHMAGESQARKRTETAEKKVQTIEEQVKHLVAENKMIKAEKQMFESSNAVLSARNEMLESSNAALLARNEILERFIKSMGISIPNTAVTEQTYPEVSQVVMIDPAKLKMLIQHDAKLTYVSNKFIDGCQMREEHSELDAMFDNKMSTNFATSKTDKKMRTN